MHVTEIRRVERREVDHFQYVRLDRSRTRLMIAMIARAYCVDPRLRIASRDGCVRKLKNDALGPSFEGRDRSADDARGSAELRRCRAKKGNFVVMEVKPFMWAAPATLLLRECLLNRVKEV